jgi:hypothetical protein
VWEGAARLALETCDGTGDVSTGRARQKAARPAALCMENCILNVFRLKGLRGNEQGKESKEVVEALLLIMLLLCLLE